MKRAIAVFVCILAMSQTGFGVLIDNTAWQNEYSVNSHTVGLLHFNTVEELGDGTGHFSREETQNPGDKWAAVTLDNDGSEATFVTSGKFGGGMHNIGNDVFEDRVTLNDSKDLMPSGSDVSISVECWVKFDAFGDYQWLVDSRTSWTSNVGYALYAYPNGELHFSLGDGSSEFGTFGSYSQGLATGQWYHIAGVWDADTDTASMYVNDEMIGHNTYDGKVVSGNSAYDVVLMNRCSSTQKSLAGTIDEFMVSDVAYNYIIPEPATTAFFLIGLGFVYGTRRK